MSTPNDPYGYDPYGRPPSYPAQGYPAAQPYPGYPVQHGDVQDPDNAMGIVGLVLNFVCCGPIGLIVSWMALNKSKARGYKNTVALVGAIIGGISTLLVVLPLLVLFAFWVIGVIALSTSSGTSVLGLL